MKSKKHLSLYKNSMISGRLPKECTGFCECAQEGLIDTETFLLFVPDHFEEAELREEGLSTSYWASGKGFYDWDRVCTFTPLRQTITLLMAAINNEL